MAAVDVFLTVDTELTPALPDLSAASVDTAIGRDIYGRTPEGEFGLGFELDALRKHGLKASFFVESLFPTAIGSLAPLQAIVDRVQQAGQEVQGHVHTEWLARMASPPLPKGRVGTNLRDFTVDEQSRLIALGLENLRKAGASGLCAFRAGNYGANFDTLRALHRNGIAYDTSYNYCYLDTACGLRTDRPLVQPERLEEVWEYPVTFFRDYPGHARHAQLCACSAGELRAVLEQAWKRGWGSFVIVLHSFELIVRNHRSGKPPACDPVVVGRFEKLCRFLADNRDKFKTRSFSELAREPARHLAQATSLSSSPIRTLWRYGEQIFRRLR